MWNLTHPCTLCFHCKATRLLKLSKSRQELHTQFPTNYNSKSPNSLRGQILHFSFMLFYFLVASPHASKCFMMFSLLNMDHLHRANTLAVPFSQQTGGAGWHMFLPLAIALHTLDRQDWIQQWEKSPTGSEQAHLLQMQLPNMQSGFKFGVDISDLIPHLNTKDVAKKINVHMEVASQCQVPRLAGWKCPSWGHAAYAPVQRHPEICHFFESKIITNIHEQHL